jgi:hypothetical protein
MMPADAAPPLWEVSRRSHLSAWRAFNSLLDTVFYDVGALSSQERVTLSGYVKPEGSILIVYPADAVREIRSLTPEAFVREQLEQTSDAVRTVVVAGVGSSAVGTAALARGVADYLGTPVAGIVSGLGLADVVSEALGGWFVFGARNALREIVARFLDAFALKDHVRDPETHRDLKAHVAPPETPNERFLYGSPDSTTLLYLLERLGDGLRLLVGHSKGNYSIENALEGWAGSPNAKLQIVTLGAVIWFPSQFTDLQQFIGDIDYFGMLNSRIFVQRIGVPGAGHSLNTALPRHVSVRDALDAAHRLRPLQHVA